MVWTVPPARSPPLLTAISCLYRGSNSPYVATGFIYGKSKSNSGGALTLSGPQDFPSRSGVGLGGGLIRRFGHFEGASSTASATAEDGNDTASSESLGRGIDIVGEHSNDLWIHPDNESATAENSSSREPSEFPGDSYTTMWKQQQQQQQQQQRWRPVGAPAPSNTVPGGAPWQPWRNPPSPHLGYNQAYPPLPIRNGAYRGDRMQGRGWNQRDNRRWQDSRQGERFMREPRMDDCRHWLDSKEKFTPGEKFLFLSYNILSADNAREHYGDLYYHIPMRFVKWDWRKSRLTQEIEHWSPDILCLQEVDRFEDLQQELQKKGYAGIYKVRTGTATDGCATFWKENRFLLLQEESVEFRELDLRDNVAQFCVLKSTSAKTLSNTSEATDMRETTVTPNNCVVVANTHVLFNPKRGDIKLGQVRTLLDTAYELSVAWGGAQIIIAGDFNSTPSSPLYRFISTAELDVCSLDRRAISGQLADGEGYRSYQSYRPNPRYLRQQYKEVSRAQETSTVLTESARITPENNFVGNGTVAEQSTRPLDQLEERDTLAAGVEVVGIVVEQAATLDQFLENNNMAIKAGDEHFGTDDIASVSISETQIATEVVTTEVRSASQTSLIQSSESVATLLHSSEGEMFFEDAWERETGVSTIEAASREGVDKTMEEMHRDTVSTSQNEYRHFLPYGWTAEELQNATGSAECTKLSHKMRLRSAYSGIEGKAGSRDPKGEPLATTYHKKFMGTVDYIWHTEGLRPLRVLDILPVEALRRTGGLPTQKWGSDHLALVCEMVFLGDHGSSC